MLSVTPSGSVTLQHVAAKAGVSISTASRTLTGSVSISKATQARVRSAADPASARDAWILVQRRLADEAPAAWLYHSRGVQGVSGRLRGVTMDLRGEMATLARWYVGS